MRIIAWSSDVCSSDLSVARDRRIHVLRPGVDAAGDVENLAETLRAEVVGCLRAAPAVVAEETQRQVAGLGQQAPEPAGVAHSTGQGDGRPTGRAHVRTQVTNANNTCVCRLETTK